MGDDFMSKISDSSMGLNLSRENQLNIIVAIELPN